MTITVKVGDPIWRFDHNRRVYRKNEHGDSVGGPIWRERWRRDEIVGETARSLLVGPQWCQTKLPKSAFRDGGCPPGWALSEEHIDRLAWVHENAYRLGAVVQRLGDYEKLRAIAEIVGYKDAEPSR